MMKTTIRPLRLIAGTIALATVALLVGYGIRKAIAEGAPTADPLYFSGTLTEGGTLVSDETRNITVALYLLAERPEPPAPPDTPECQSEPTLLPIREGRFRVPLPNDCAGHIAAHPDLWAEVSVDGARLSPRTKLGAVPYALEATHAATVGPAAVPVGQVLNCRLAIEEGTSSLAVVGRDGPLSAQAPCLVAVNDSRVAVFAERVNVTFGAGSDTDHNLFGISEADWGSPMPLFLGVVYDDRTAHFVISRLPIGITGTAATNLCKKGHEDCDSQGDAMILEESDSAVVLSDWTSKPILQVGWYQATYISSSEFGWTFQLTDRTGFNSEYEKIAWSFPKGQNGAATSSWFAEESGSFPGESATGETYQYWVGKEGEVTIRRRCTFSTPGSASGRLYMAMPYQLPMAFVGAYVPVGHVRASSGCAGEGQLWFLRGVAGPVGLLRYCDATGGISDVGVTGVASGDVLTIEGWSYRAF